MVNGSGVSPKRLPMTTVRPDAPSMTGGSSGSLLQRRISERSGPFFDGDSSSTNSSDFVGSFSSSLAGGTYGGGGRLYDDEVASSDDDINNNDDNENSDTFAADVDGPSESQRHGKQQQPSPSPTHRHQASLTPLPGATARPTVAAATVGLCNTIMGTGMVSVPFALSTVGAGWGSLALLGSAAATWFSLRLLVSAAEIALGRRRIRRPSSSNTSSSPESDDDDEEPSYGVLAHAAFGHHGAIAAEAAVAASCLGFAVSYLVSLAETMPRAAAAVAPESITGTWIAQLIASPIVWLVLSLLVVAPLCYARSVDDFNWFSITALGSALYVAAVVVCLSFSVPHPHKDPNAHPSIPWFSIRSGAIETVTIYIFAFTCHQNIFAMYTEVGASYRNGSLTPEMLRYIRRIIDLSMLAVALLYLTVGVVGYAAFGDATMVVVLDNFPDTAAVVLGRVMFALLAALSVPIQVHPCRSCIESMMKSVTEIRRARSCADAFVYHRLNGQEQPHMYVQAQLPPSSSSSTTVLSTRPTSVVVRAWTAVKTMPGLPTLVRTTRRKFRHWMREEQSRQSILTTGIMFLTYAIAVWFHEIGPVMSFVGGTSGVVVCFVLPAAFFWHLTTPVTGGWRRPFSLVLATLGILCGILNISNILFGGSSG